MQIVYDEQGVTIHMPDAPDMAQTLSCGQCFRWRAHAQGGFAGVAYGEAARVENLPDGGLRIDCRPGTFDALWRDYFDLGRDYALIRRAVSRDAHTAQAAAFGAGLRILRQEPWEALCSFILSACNNIPRIMGIVDTLCRRFGEPVTLCGEVFYTFPSADTVASLPLSALDVLRAGYRAPYLWETARRVAAGETDLDALRVMPTQAARDALVRLPGVGVKVASCVLLFGLGKLDAFPVDVWVRRALEARYGPGFDPAAAFGPYAGVAQQYIFYYEREQAQGKRA